MNIIIDFINSYSGLVAFGAGILGVLSGLMGVFIVIREKSLVGDAIAHASLPGIGLAFLVVGSKDSLVLMVGATFSGLIALFLISTIEKRTKIKFDSLLAIILSSFFGLGIILISYIRRNLTGHSGLQSYIFGQAAGFLRRDLSQLFVMLAIMILMIVLFYKEMKLYSFDFGFMESLGYNTSIISFLINTLTVMTVVVGLQIVGIILMSAMIIAPASAARLLSNKLKNILIYSAIIGFIGGYFGTVFSVIYKIPTGPSISISLLFLVFLSMVFSPDGIIKKLLSRRND